jgi:transcriptional regulator with XRE-family HTH domain
MYTQDILSYIIDAMMSGQELQEHIRALGLTQAEAAQLLGISARTVNRWCTESEEVSGPAEAALRAWRRLDTRHLAWRPDSVSIVEDNAERIATHRQEAINLDDILRRVEARGGPQLPWAVSLSQSEATLGRIHVSFYKLQNGGFSVSVYSRRDGVHPDVQRDWPLIEDAVFCITQEFEKHRRRADALKAAAAEIRSKSNVFGQRGPRLLDPMERADRQKAIKVQADQIDALAERAAEGLHTTYREFNAILSELSNLGYSPPSPSFVSAVARNYVEHRARVRILLVRSGAHETPVTKAIEADEAQANRLVAGYHLKYLGTRLPPIGETSRLTSFTGPQHVVLEVSPGANVSGAQEPGLYLVRDMAPERVARSQQSAP